MVTFLGKAGAAENPKGPHIHSNVYVCESESEAGEAACWRKNQAQKQCGEYAVYSSFWKHDFKYTATSWQYELHYAAVDKLPNYSEMNHSQGT